MCNISWQCYLKIKILEIKKQGLYMRMSLLKSWGEPTLNPLVSKVLLLGALEFNGCSTINDKNFVPNKTIGTNFHFSIFPSFTHTSPPTVTVASVIVVMRLNSPSTFPPSSALLPSDNLTVPAPYP